MIVIGFADPTAASGQKIFIVTKGTDGVLRRQAISLDQIPAWQDKDKSGTIRSGGLKK